MKDCKSCEYETLCVIPESLRSNINDCKVYEPKKKKTNADKIRAMSDEELAEFLSDEKIKDESRLCSDFGYGCHYYCKKNHACHDNTEQLFIEWLQSEAE